MRDRDVGAVLVAEDQSLDGIFTAVREAALTTEGWRFGTGISLVSARNDRLAFSVASGNFSRQPGAHAAIGVDDRQPAGHPPVTFHSRHQLLVGKQLVLQDRSVGVGLGFMRQPGTIGPCRDRLDQAGEDRKSTRLNSSHRT